MLRSVIRITPTVSLLVIQLLSLSYPESTSGGFSCNVSQYYARVRTRFSNLYCLDPSRTSSDVDEDDNSINDRDNEL